MNQQAVRPGGLRFSPGPVCGNGEATGAAMSYSQSVMPSLIVRHRCPVGREYFPGKTTKRDLIAEMAQALNAKGIKLMCYFPTHVIGN